NAEKFVGWLENTEPNEEVINLFLSYGSFGDRQSKESGIFDFLETLSQAIIQNRNLKFATPTEVVEELQPVSVVSVPYPISWADEERDLTAWLGNKMQKEAFDKLYHLKQKMDKCSDTNLIKDWNYLQVSDHFYYMSTKSFSDGEVHNSFNPFDSPYEAFINYMNVLSDFKIRLDLLIPDDKTENEISNLQKNINKKDVKIKKLEAQLIQLQKEKKRRKK
ncbi:MAG: alpha-amylase, partial [Draconibacterium sp.]|nr:alpha-amylase [Draconibacterium sp.]